MKQEVCEWGVWYTGFIWLEMRSSAVITKNDGKLAQAIPTICTYS